MQVSSVEVFGHVTSADKKTDGIFEDKIIFTVKTADLGSIDFTERQSYIKGKLLPPDDYKLFIVIRDSVSGKTGAGSFKIKVPNL